MTLTLETRTSSTRTVWETVCSTAELEPSWGEAAVIRARRIALFFLGGDEAYATDLRDPRHGAEVMARGIVGSKGARPTVASPLHKEVYDLGTGECFTNPELLLGTYHTRIVGGFIEVEVPA